LALRAGGRGGGLRAPPQSETFPTQFFLAHGKIPPRPPRADQKKGGVGPPFRKLFFPRPWGHFSLVSRRPLPSKEPRDTERRTPQPGFFCGQRRVGKARRPQQKKKPLPKTPDPSARAPFPTGGLGRANRARHGFDGRFRPCFRPNVGKSATLGRLGLPRRGSTGPDKNPRRAVQGAFGPSINFSAWEKKTFPFSLPFFRKKISRFPSPSTREGGRQFDPDLPGHRFVPFGPEVNWGGGGGLRSRRRGGPGRDHCRQAFAGMGLVAGAVGILRRNTFLTGALLQRGRWRSVFCPHGARRPAGGGTAATFFCALIDSGDRHGGPFFPTFGLRYSGRDFWSALRPPDSMRAGLGSVRGSRGPYGGNPEGTLSAGAR